jgi:hypothetical protein
MRWHPPIPANKLYSGPALDLGPALAMLVWCYDGIDKDGTIEVSIEQAAQEIGKPYRTVKGWWRQLREGPFFTKVQDHGRRGWIVRMADDWIDWRIMQHNYPSVQGQNVALQDVSSRSDEGQEAALEDAQSPLKARSKPGEGQHLALESSAYKVLHNDQESESHESVCEDRDGTERAHTHQDHPGVRRFLGAFPQIRLSDSQIARMASLIGDGVERLQAWNETVQDYEDNYPRWEPGNLSNVYDRFKKKLAARQAERTNGHAASDVRPPLPRETYRPPTDALPPEEVARRMKERMR